jgi:osmotically-inducible protein OsmY
MGTTHDVRDAVEKELRFDPLVDASGITVKAMNGEVALNGTVPSYRQYAEAPAAARRVAGVRNVHSHLKVVLPPGDYRDDATLTTAANNALALNVGAPGSVKATASNGDVLLTGSVRYAVEQAAALNTIAGLTGVRNVHNEIVIRSDADPVDAALHVRDALDRSALIPDDSDVAVQASGNTVTLSGHVRTSAEHDAVVDAAWRAIGVNDVRDLLHVTG